MSQPHNKAGPAYGNFLNIFTRVYMCTVPVYSRFDKHRFTEKQYLPRVPVYNMRYINLGSNSQKELIKKKTPKSAQFNKKKMDKANPTLEID